MQLAALNIVQEFYPALRTLLILLQPLAPHLSAHLWELAIGASPQVHFANTFRIANDSTPLVLGAILR